MTQFQAAPTIPLKTGTDRKHYVDYKSVDDLRRLMTQYGKIYTRMRLAAPAREQRRVAQGKRPRERGWCHGLGLITRCTTHLVGNH